MQVLKKTTVMAAGWAFVGLGTIGLFLPVLQGVLFLALGLYLLSRHSLWAERMVKRFRTLHPTLARAFDATERRLERVVGVSASRR